MTKPEAKRLLVIQYEQFFDADDAGDLIEAIRRGLEALREYGGAHVIGSYSTSDPDFTSRSQRFITLTTPVKLEVD